MHRRQLKLLSLYNGIFILAGNLLVPLYSVYLQQFQQSVVAISLSWSVFLASTTIFSFMVSRHAHKWKQKQHFLLAGYALRAVVWFGFIFVNTVPALLVMQGMLGLGEALGSPAFDALFAEKIGSSDRIVEYSRWKVMANLMTAIGAGLGGVIVATLGFAPLFLIMSMLAIVSFIGILYTDMHSEQLPTLGTLAVEYAPTLEPQAASR